MKHTVKQTMQWTSSILRTTQYHRQQRCLLVSLSLKSNWVHQKRKIGQWLALLPTNLKFSMFYCIKPVSM